MRPMKESGPSTKNWQICVGRKYLPPGANLQKLDVGADDVCVKQQKLYLTTNSYASALQAVGYYRKSPH